MLEASTSGEGTPVWRREKLWEPDRLEGTVLSGEMFEYVSEAAVPADAISSYCWLNAQFWPSWHREDYQTF